MATLTSITGMRPISADSHIMEPPDCYTANIESRYKDRAPHVVRDAKRGDIYVIPGMDRTVSIPIICAAGVPADQLRLEGKTFDDIHRGSWDPKARLVDMDRDGVAAEVIFPSTGMLIYSHDDADFAQACHWAYNRWLEGYVSAAPQRLYGIGCSQARSPEELKSDIEKFHGMGFRGVMLPEAPVVEDYDSALYDPVWEAATGLSMPLCYHLLPGSRSSSSPMFGTVRGGKLNGLMGVVRTNQDIIGVFIFGGVFDRHPGLKLVCVEADAGWAPHYMYRMDHAYDRHRHWLQGKPLSRMPSEFFRENVYLTFQDDFIAYRTSHLLDHTRLLWASDYPHSDSIWPHSREVIAEQTEGMDESTIRHIVHDNAQALFNIRLS